MSAQRRPYIISSVVVITSFVWLLAQPLSAQDLSWVDGAIERSKHAVRENLPAWQYDPRVAAGQADASLNGLAVVSADRVWAVGDRGLILASSDGGRTWATQYSGTSLNLYGVSFWDENRGVIVGGTVQPLSQTSVGIVLVTENAGLSWQVMAPKNKMALPRLTGVLIDQRQSIKAWGDYSPIHGSGVFESVDRAQSWQAVASPLGHVQSLAQQPQGMQLGIDRAGRMCQLPGQPNRPITQLALPTTPIWSLMHNGQSWWAVGDGGTVASSPDGLKWVDHALPLSAPARAVCEFRCASAFEQNIWVAGKPGSILLNSADAGATWRVVPTDQNWSITALAFIDRHRGWFVTTAGSIFATRDGGANWFAQRVPNKRLGMQAFAMTPSQVSWPALADATWQARQATALTVVHRENVEDAVDFTPDVPAMLAALGTQTGLVDAQLESSWPIADARVRNLAAVASSYPASQPTLAATALGLAPSGKAAGGASGVPSVIDGLVMQLRAGRPTVVLVDDVVGMSSGSNLLQDAVAQAMLLAASDDARTAWLQHELRLAPWTASKLFATTGTERADFTITHDLLLRDSGLTVSDVLAPVFGWQGLTTRNAGLRCLQLGSGGNAARQNLFHTGDRHADTQRMVDLSKIGNLQLVMGRVHRDRAWQRLAPNPLNAEEDLSSWLNKLELIIEKTPRPEVGAALLNLAESCLLAEHWSRWQAVLDRASTYAPLTDTARWSTLATLRFGASDERLAWEMTTQSQADQPRKSDDQLAQSGGKTRLPSATDSTPFERDGRPSTVVTANAELASGNASSGGGLAPSVRTVAAEMPIEARQAAGQVKQVAALRAVVNQFNQMAELDKGLVLRPDVQLAHFARRRALAELAGEPVPDAGALQLMAQATHLAGWQQAADQEAVLASGRATLPAWTARAVRAVEPPRLDGKPNDACWQAAQTIELTSPFHQVEQTVGPAKVRFCYDADYLYVWMECPQAPNWQGQQPPDSKAPRRYDMNLDGSDHVVFSLDTDRDYTSACELAVNEAGQTYDRCCLSSHWNPHWYVDVDRFSGTHNQAGLDTQTGLVSQAGPGSQPGKWSAEFAVKLSDLTMAPSVAGRVWAISVFRYLPQWDVQSWSQLRSYNPRQQGNGLLMFLP